MDQIFECVIAGGPQHGQVCQRIRAVPHAAPPAIFANDGHLCRAAARKHYGTSCTRIILLHPQATGAQFLTMLAA